MKSNMCCRWNGGFGWVGMIIGILLILALIIGGIILISWLFKRAGTSNYKRVNFTASSSALDIARERYAKGEISREEYQNLVSELEKR